MPQTTNRFSVRWRRVLAWIFAPLGPALAAAWFTFASMPGCSHRGALPPLTEDGRAAAERLRATVVELCAHGERNLDHPAGQTAAIEAIARALASTGATVVHERFTTGARGEAVNVYVDLRGSAAADELVIVGAHYDSAHDSPGANDNASGVAALCELAQRCAQLPHARTLRFVAFANEEPPYFWTDEMGSVVHARGAKKRGEKVVAMLSLETLGCYRDEPGSQHYPIDALATFYPDRGNFVAVVGDVASRALVRECIGVFREHAEFPSEGAALPASIPGVGWSDHWSFWQEGWPAVMVTDTALFRDESYHTPLDAPERLDYERLARVVGGLAHVLDALAR
jgi:hypothetical protein